MCCWCNSESVIVFQSFIYPLFNEHTNTGSVTVIMCYCLGELRYMLMQRRTIITHYLCFVAERRGGTLKCNNTE